MYALVSTVHETNKDLIAVEQNLQDGAVGFSTLFPLNKMFINLIKISPGTRHNLHHMRQMHIITDNEIIQNVGQKLLGVKRDRTL